MDQGKFVKKQLLKNFKWYGLFKQTIYYSKFFKRCLPQILFDPFNNLSPIWNTKRNLFGPALNSDFIHFLENIEK